MQSPHQTFGQFGTESASALQKSPTLTNRGQGTRQTHSAVEQSDDIAWCVAAKAGSSKIAPPPPSTLESMRHPHNRFAITLALRELAFSGGPLALAASLTKQGRERIAHILATIARYFIAIPIMFYSFEQFMHGDHVPGVPLEMVTPQWLYGHAIWTHLAALLYAFAGIPLLLGKKTRAATTWVGLTVLFVELVVYVPIGVVQRADIEGMNYMFDTLMFCGAVLLLAGISD